MQTDSWSAWKRAVRFGMRALRDGGLFRPSFFLALGIFLLAGAAALSVLGVARLESSLASQATITVELQSSVGSDQVQTLYEQAGQLPGVASAQYVTKEQALTQQRAAHPDLAAFLDRYQLQNPFPNLLLIKLRSPSALPQLRAFLEDAKWQSVLAPSAATTLAEREQEFASLDASLVTARTAAAAGSAFLIMLLLALVTDLVWSRLTHRREERKTVMLLGGGFADHDGPVFVEIVVLLWAAALLAGLLLAGGVALLPQGTEDPFLGALFTSLENDAWRSLPVAVASLVIFLPIVALLAALFSQLRSRRMHG